MALAASVRPYLHFARCAFQRRAAYRLANWTGIAVNFFFFLIHAQVLLAFFGERRLAAGYRPEDAVLYFALSEALMGALGVFPDWNHNLAVRIRSGDVACDLARPVRLVWRDLAERAGVSLYYLVARTSVLLAGAVAVYGVLPPPSPTLLWLPLSLGLAIAVAAALWNLAFASAFWLETPVTSLANALVFVHTVLGGVVVPLDFYPDALRLVCDALPFRAALYTPVALAAGKLEGAELAFGLVHQGVWLGLLLAAAFAVEARGVRRLVVQGG
jgi:ABC-2 type transport system permease protein